MTAAEIVSVIKDVVIILAAIIASVMGVLGLSAWRRQLYGNTKHQLAKSILTSVYELRDRIDWVRRPLKIRPPEPDQPEEKLKKLDRSERIGTRWFRRVNRTGIRFPL